MVQASGQRPAPEIANWARDILRTRAGDLLLRKTGDPTLLRALERWFFPLSRLWAAANEAGGDVERFQALRGRDGANGRIASRLVGGLLRSHDAARSRMRAARDTWERVAFAADTDGEAPDLARLDVRRRKAATLHLASRSLFYPLLFPGPTPPAHWEMPAPADVDAIWGDALADPAAFFSTVVTARDVEVSHATTSHGLREFWIRFPTPAARLQQRAETALCYARVTEPSDGREVPTLITGGGLCLETDLVWPAAIDASGFIQADFRIVDVISPYHGLRAWTDRYGGEPFFATAPLGTIDLVVGQTLETAALIGWCRERFGGKIAVGGISMTSFVAQQIASRCAAWPAALQPDGVLLIGHTGDMIDVILNSALVQSIGLDKALQRAGWTEEALRHWSPLLDPTSSPALPRHRIVSALATGDRVLPYAGGAALAERWGLPPENVFHFPVGHIVLPLGLMRDDQPLRRMQQILSNQA